MKTDYGRKSARDAVEIERRRATFAGTGVMEHAAALWVLDNVLTYQKGMPLLRCRCLYRPCGPCGRGSCRSPHGEHDTCTNGRLRDARPSQLEETWMSTKPGWAVGTPVYLADRLCRYVCPCTDCSAERPWIKPATPARPVQLDLFGAA